MKHRFTLDLIATSKVRLYLNEIMSQNKLSCKR